MFLCSDGAFSSERSKDYVWEKCSIQLEHLYGKALNAWIIHFLFCPASLGRILSEMKGHRRHVEREIQMLMVYLRRLSKNEFSASQ